MLQGKRELKSCGIGNIQDVQVTFSWAKTVALHLKLANSRADVGRWGVGVAFMSLHCLLL